ncbi:TonB-dependent receptor [Novosphingobium flavum]|uniref:TonB-dependent receptor n=1 Tax=Novosphingobium flavum TaxID=1778672 RepID=A0A7X1FT70_9SPHN|nr:TonB-dependent receptor [Novosphingobium flavum]MBC2665902.1 TonB-dependent receptor [Novosphingobium flavum]
MKQIALVALLATTGLVVPGAAMAQTAAQAAEEVTEAVDAADIVVTGSRVSTNANSPTPLTVLPADQFLKLQPTTAVDALALMPAMMGSQGTSSRPGGGQRNGAAAYLSLRNMGDLRTLILMDGQRVVPTINSNQAQVDAAVVPQLLLKRVDMVTGGVSAVYGSDGVSGVINFVTDRDFNGVKLQANNGISTYGDARTWDVGIAAGTRFADDRGHIEFSYQHLKDHGVVDRRDSLDRAIYAANTGGAGTGTSANPYFNIPDMRQSNMTFGGRIVSVGTSADSAALNGLQFTSPTTLAAFNNGLLPIVGGSLAPFSSALTVYNATSNPTGTIATGNVQSGGDGAYYASSSIKHASSADQAFGRFDFDLTEDIHFFAQLAYSRLVNSNQFRSPAFNGNASLRFSYANPYLWNVQGTAGTLFRSNPGRFFNMGILLLNAPTSQNTTETWMAHTGFEGKIGEKLNWTLTGGKSRSVINSEDFFNFRRDKFAAALDAVDVGQVTTGTPSGQIACRATVAYTGHAANPNLAGCVPLNVFGGIQNSSPQALAWLYETTFNRHVTRLETISGSVTGQPFETWAGPVKMALSGEWRQIRWDVTSNADPLDLAPDCAGILYNCTAGTTVKWFNNSFGAISGAKQTVKEGAFEVQVPLLRDQPMFQDLSVTGAVRLTDYSTSGKVTTWKLGADWHINDDIRIRATRSRDIRAPNLFEMFSSVKQNCATTTVDKLTGATNNNNCNIERPNPNLTPELADTLTAGVVLTPGFIPGLTLSVDYYRIKVKDVVFLVQGFNQNVLANCADLKGAPAICSIVVNRKDWIDTNPATNPILNTESQFFNIANQRTWGIDFEANYNTKLGERPLNLRLLAAYQPQLDYDQGPVGVLTMAGAFNVGTNRFSASPKWRLTGIASLDVTDNISFTWLQRWRSGLNAYYDPAIQLVQSKLPALGTTTLNLSYKFEDNRLGNGELFLNVRNVFNAFPTSYYSGQVTQPSSQPFLPEGDDTLGRYFTVGFRLKL